MFVDSYPSIDLHGEDRVNAIILTNDFINDSIKLKYKTIVIIHGKGEGILKKAIHEYLKKDKRIKDYRLDINTGETIVDLKI